MSILSLMIKKKIIIFGSTGQIGRHLIRKLTKNNYKVTCQTRNSHKAVFLKTSGPIGFIDIAETNIFDKDKLNKLLSESDICINLIGILFEKGINSFQNIHVKFPDLLSKLCEKNNVNLIHVSALGIEQANDSEYAKSKMDGEKKIKTNCKNAVIIKPSIVYSVNDNFTTKFMSMLSLLPFFPLYYNGSTKFTPIHASDLSDLIFFVIDKEIQGKNIEALGPEVINFKNIMKQICDSINKKRILIPLPLSLAKFSAYFFQKLPKPLITLDQLKLLKYDNIKSNINISNFDIGCPSKIKFVEGIKKYSYNWTEGGQFSRNKNR